jgi:hypothetical protein
MKIKCGREGRENIYLPERESLIEWIKYKKLNPIHNFTQSGFMVLGADYSQKSVIQDIENAERLAIFTNNAGNMGHNLSIIRNNKLECYDIGRIEIEDIEIT